MCFIPCSLEQRISFVSRGLGSHLLTRPRLNSTAIWTRYKSTRVLSTEKPGKTALWKQRMVKLYHSAFRRCAVLIGPELLDVHKPPEVCASHQSPRDNHPTMTKICEAMVSSALYWFSILQACPPVIVHSNHSVTIKKLNHPSSSTHQPCDHDDLLFWCADHEHGDPSSVAAHDERGSS